MERDLQKCEECGEPLKPNEEITFTEDTLRFWHTQCFESSLTPIKDWPKSDPR